MFAGTLSQLAQDALAILGKSGLLNKAYLAGGSALALHLGHRYSLDFDFFSQEPLQEKLIEEALSKLGTFEVQMVKEHTILGVFNAVKFSLFHYDYPLIAKLETFSHVAIADPADIAAMKIVAIVDRGTKRDFVDLYFLRRLYTWETIFAFYDKKYQKLANNLYTIITSLRYFEDAKLTDMPQMIKSLSWNEVEHFFESEAIRLGKKYL